MHPSRPFKRGGSVRPGGREPSAAAAVDAAAASYLDRDYRDGDILLVGREFAGAPEEVHAAADLTLRIPMCGGMRSLNVAVAAAIVTSEALRQPRAR